MNKTKKHTVLKKAMLLFAVAASLNVYAGEDAEALNQSRPLSYKEVRDGFSKDTKGSKDALLFLMH